MKRLIFEWLDARKAVDAEFHRFHCWLFEDDEWCREDYVVTYAPLVLFIAFEVSVYVIAGIVN